MWRLLISYALFLFSSVLIAADRPNILWISSEDHGPQMGCYGDKQATTPNVDALAARGLLFSHVWSNAPVCAAARTTIITGMYPPGLGAEHMRSEVPMAPGYKLFPAYLHDAGYFCTNNSKEDYNVKKSGTVWDMSSGNAHWKERKDGQPFFAIFNSSVSHEGHINSKDALKCDPAKLRIPSYHPDTPAVREDWAHYYDGVTAADAIAGKLLKEIEKAGLTEDTIVFYWADHGSGMPRSKRWPCNSGLHVPLVVYFPEKWKHLAPEGYAAGAKSDRLVSFVDFAPTMLSIAGIEPPSWMQGRAFAGSFQQPGLPVMHGFRGRMDERPDVVRSVTDGRYVYVRNYMPYRSQGQHVRTQFKTRTTQIWWQAFLDNTATPAQRIFWEVPKAAEELYDLQNDPDEVINLASDPAHAETLLRLRTAQQQHAAAIRDVGLLTEGEVALRRGEDAPFTMGHDTARYNFPAIFAAADYATRPEATIEQLQTYLKDADSGVRYWGAVGLLTKGQAGFDAAGDSLRAALSDDNASVRVIAAEALGRFGSQDDLNNALAALKLLADPKENNFGVGIHAMITIDELGERAQPLASFIKTMNVKDPKAPGRPNGYVVRLQEKLNERFNN